MRKRTIPRESSNLFFTANDKPLGWEGIFLTNFSRAQFIDVATNRSSLSGLPMIIRFRSTNEHRATGRTGWELIIGRERSKPPYRARVRWDWCEKSRPTLVSPSPFIPPMLGNQSNR